MSDKMTTIDAGSFEREVLQESRAVVVDFYSTECPPCDALAAKYEGLAESYGADIKFIKIHRQANRELAQQLGVTSSPTVLFYAAAEPGGSDSDRRRGDVLTGGVRRADLQRNLDALLTPERAAELRGGAKKSETECDVLILGAGPAGLTAGIYASQAKLDTIAIDLAMAGGNLNFTHQVSNFPGFPTPQPGMMLAHLMREHAVVAGVMLREAVDVTHLDLNSREVVLDGVETIRAKKIIVATGSSPRPIGVTGEREYKGKGLSYCATCDAKYYEDKHVIVIGGGNSAIEEALFITKFASRITIVHQFDKLQANKEAQERAFANPKIDFVFEHEPREFLKVGETVGAVVVQDLRSGELKTLACDGVFIFAGMQPNLEGLADWLELDEWGYVRVDDQMRTNLPSVWAAGDVRSKTFRQMTTAVSDGTIAAMSLARELGA